MRPPKKFIKKVPPSGGPPAFKLTLPHQVVHKHLLHLIDADFDLAPSALAEQTWQGSIAPRRNKERSEYTLQGWKLFAEAHHVRAGDQVSFELVSPHKMVIQIIKPNEAASSSFGEGRAAKVSRRSQTCSPGSSSGAMTETKHEPQHSDALQLEDHPESWMEAMMLEAPMMVDQDWVPLANRAVAELSCEGQQALPDSRHLEVAQPLEELSIPQQVEDPNVKLSPDAQGTLSMELSQSISDSKYLMPVSPISSAQAAQEHQAGQVPVLEQSPRGTSPAPSRKRSIGALSSLPAGSTTTLVKDNLLSSTPDGTETFQAQAVAGDYFDAEDTDNSEEGPSLAPGLHLNNQLGTLTSSIQALQCDVQRFENRAGLAETEVDNMKKFFNRIQSALDRQSKSALRAATFLEKTTKKLSAPQLLSSVEGKTAEHILAVQSDLYNCLGALKGSLWQLLIVTLEEESQTFSAGREGV